jgi:DNA-binding beta-propeller fold protein YncE
MKRVYAGHKVSKLGELTEEDIITQEPNFQSCSVHKQPMNVYCFDCKSLICRDCTIKDHLGHNYEFVVVAAPEMKKKLIQQLIPLHESYSKMERTMGNIQTTISDVESQGKISVQHIESSFAELQEIIDARKREYLKDTALKVEQKSKHLSEQRNGLSIACAAVQKVIDYTEHCVEHLADDEIMTMHTEIQCQINSEKKEQKKKEKTLLPVEEVDLGVKVGCVDDLKQLCLTREPNIEVAETKQTENVTLASSAEVNKPYQYFFGLLTKPADGKSARQALACSLKSLANDSNTECRVERIDNNTCRIVYTPTHRGRHEQIVTMNGREVAGSPFPVFVSINPTLLNAPIRVIAGLTYPDDIAITISETIIVTTPKEIKVFNKYGKKLRNLKLDIDPLGIAVDNRDGSIYICDRNNRIVKFNPSFKLLREFTGDLSLQYNFLAVVGDEVVVTEISKCLVMVFSKDLKHLRDFGSHGDELGQLKSVMGVASAENRKLYVSDYGRGCVNVYSNTGEFLHSFGQGKELSGPAGICVAGQYVYVADHNGHCVSVFTTEGKYVTSFGCRGEGEGEFTYPRGVCVDKDGFVYVCESGFNGRLQIF